MLSSKSSFVALSQRGLELGRANNYKSLCSIIKPKKSTFETSGKSLLSSTPINYDRKKERPLSPHITIYAWPVSAIASISIRGMLFFYFVEFSNIFTLKVTGVALTVGMYGIGLGSLAGLDVAPIMQDIGNSGVGALAKFSISFPIIYHLLGGMRHLYWEKMPDGLTNESQYWSSIVLFGASGLISTTAALI